MKSEFFQSACPEPKNSKSQEASRNGLRNPLFDKTYFDSFVKDGDNGTGS